LDLVRGTESDDDSIVLWYGKKLTGDGKPATAERIIKQALDMGLTVSDLDKLTLGMLNDLALEFIDGAEEGEDEAREATQADFDAF